MKILLDTHVWLWLQTSPERLGPAALAAAGDRRNTLLLSAASSWEIAIKVAIGRLTLPEPPEIYVPDRMRRSGVEGLAIDHGHALAVAGMPPRHRDPFDRLLIAQAQMNGLRLMTADPSFDSYDVDLIPATG